MRGKHGITAVMVSGFLVAGAGAAPVDIVSSIADYEPRMEQDSSGGPFIINDQNDLSASGLGSNNIDTPTDSNNVRVGGQSRHKFNSAFFFPLPTLSATDQVDSAHLSFDMLQETSTAGTAPTYNGDLWAVGLYSDIAVSNDYDDPQVNQTTAPGLSSLLYLESDSDAAAGLNTSIARTKLVDDFLTSADFLPASGTTATAPKETDASADAALAAYLNELYAAGVPEGSYLVIRVNPDVAPTTDTNRWRIASANHDDAALHPTLTLDVVAIPEPAGMALLGVAAAGLLARQRRWRR